MDNWSDYDHWKTTEPDQVGEPKPETPPPEVSVYELATRILSLFDDYKITDTAPIVSELEKALDAEYIRGVWEGRRDE